MFSVLLGGSGPRTGPRVSGEKPWLSCSSPIPGVTFPFQMLFFLWLVDGG